MYLEGNSSEEVTIIRAGRKQLTLAVYPFGKASARIDNMEGLPREEGETTAVLTAAKDVLERRAQELGRPIRLELETSWPSMKGMFQTDGRDIFQWDPVPMVDDPQRLRVEVEIRPK